MSSIPEKDHSSSSESKRLVKREATKILKTCTIKNTSFYLEKDSVYESDMAVCYCALGDKVAETTVEAEHKVSSRGMDAGHLIWDPSG
jgi:hypothetical protein